MGLFRKEKEVLVCPECGSKDKEYEDAIQLDHSILPTLGGNSVAPPFFKCRKCGYKGLFVSKVVKK
jgi:DNA-directed RNA polymerase subunit RPC12/RpoP